MAGGAGGGVVDGIFVYENVTKVRIFIRHQPKYPRARNSKLVFRWTEIGEKDPGIHRIAGYEGQHKVDIMLVNNNNYSN